MKFQAFHVNPGEKLKKKDVNNDLSNFMSVFPTTYIVQEILWTQFCRFLFNAFYNFLEQLRVPTTTTIYSDNFLNDFTIDINFIYV